MPNLSDSRLTSKDTVNTKGQASFQVPRKPWTVAQAQQAKALEPSEHPFFRPLVKVRP